MKLPLSTDFDSVRTRLDQVFSRQVLGAVIVAIAAKKVLSLGFHLLFSDPATRFAAWFTLFAAAVVLFAWWDYAEETTEKAAREAVKKTATAAERAADRAAASTRSEKVQAAEEATDRVVETVAEESGPRQGESDATAGATGDDEG